MLPSICFSVRRFADFLATPYAIATLFDPLHSADLLLLSTRFLSMLACRESTE